MALRYKIGTVSKILDLESYVLRFWETEFSNLKPKRTPKGQRYYTEDDLKLLHTIKTLLYEQGLTIEGARKALKSQQLNLLNPKLPPTMLELFIPQSQISPEQTSPSQTSPEQTCPSQISPEQINKGQATAYPTEHPNPDAIKIAHESPNSPPNMVSVINQNPSQNLMPDANLLPVTTKQSLVQEPTLAQSQILTQVAEELKALQDLLRG